nr:MAG TPA: hypothetical protein [Caudoviricetes sp.]
MTSMRQSVPLASVTISAYTSSLSETTTRGSTALPPVVSTSLFLMTSGVFAVVLRVVFRVVMGPSKRSPRIKTNSGRAAAGGPHDRCDHTPRAGGGNRTRHQTNQARYRVLGARALRGARITGVTTRHRGLRLGHRLAGLRIGELDEVHTIGLVLVGGGHVGTQAGRRRRRVERLTGVDLRLQVLDVLEDLRGDLHDRTVLSDQVEHFLEHELVVAVLVRDVEGAGLRVSRGGPLRDRQSRLLTRHLDADDARLEFVDTGDVGLRHLRGVLAVEGAVLDGGLRPFDVVLDRGPGDQVNRAGHRTGRVAGGGLATGQVGGVLGDLTGLGPRRIGRLETGRVPARAESTGLAVNRRRVAEVHEDFLVLEDLDVQAVSTLHCHCLPLSGIKKGPPPWRPSLALLAYLSAVRKIRPMPTDRLDVETNPVGLKLGPTPKNADLVRDTPRPTPPTPCVSAVCRLRPHRRTRSRSGPYTDTRTRSRECATPSTCGTSSPTTTARPSLWALYPSGRSRTCSMSTSSGIIRPITRATMSTGSGVTPKSTGITHRPGHEAVLRLLRDRARVPHRHHHRRTIRPRGAGDLHGPAVTGQERLLPVVHVEQFRPKGLYVALHALRNLHRPLRHLRLLSQLGEKLAVVKRHASSPPRVRRRTPPAADGAPRPACAQASSQSRPTGRPRNPHHG